MINICNDSTSNLCVGGIRSILRPLYDCGVGIAMGWTAPVPFPTRQDSLSSLQRPHRLQPPVQWVPGALSPAVKRPGREADNSTSLSAEFKYGGAVPPFPRTSLWHSAYLIKHRENFTCTYRMAVLNSEVLSLNDCLISQYEE
jgi:hypothetical protein